MTIALDAMPGIVREQVEARRKQVDNDTLLDCEICPEWFHEGQQDAWASNAGEVVISAGTQGGKTAFLPYWLLREVQRCAPFIKRLGYGRALYGGPSMTLLDSQAIPAFEEVFVEKYKLGRLIKGNKPKFYFSKEGLKKVLGFDHCPVTIHFAYTSDSANIESMTAFAMVWDECGQADNKRASYLASNRRLKAAKSQGYGRRCWGTTPYEWGWWKELVHKPAEEGKEGYSLHNFVSWMNPLLSESECRAELDRGMAMWEWEMMYLGLFTRPAAAIYGIFNDQNVVQRFPLPDSWLRYMGVDFGETNTAAVFAAHDVENDRYIIYRTYHKGKIPVIKESDEEELGHVDNWRLGEPIELSGKKTRDPLAFGGAGSENEWRDDFNAAGFAINKPLAKDVEVGIQCVHSLLSTKRLVFFHDQLNLKKEIETYARVLDDNGSPTKDIKDKKNYHRLDALRYLCVGLMTGVNETPVAANRPPKDDDDRTNRSNFNGRPQKRGRLWRD